MAGKHKTRKTNNNNNKKRMVDSEKKERVAVRDEMAGTKMFREDLKDKKGRVRNHHILTLMIFSGLPIICDKGESGG